MQRCGLNSAVSRQVPLVDSCKHGYRHREFVKEVCNHQLLNEVTVLLVSFDFCEGKRMFTVQDLRFLHWFY